MKKFIKRIALFVAAIVVFDFAFGVVCDYMNSHSEGGGIYKRHYVATRLDEDVVMFGSSRMSHHYNPFMIEDSLGLSCFNAGEDGEGIIFNYGFFKMMMKRHTPKLVICDVTGFDVDKDDRSKYIAELKPYCYDSDVMSIIKDVDAKEEWKLKSKMYRYNSMCIRLLGNMVSTQIYDHGYLPLDRVMDYEPDDEPQEDVPTDSLKLRYIEDMIRDCKAKNVPIVFAVSPRYNGHKYARKYTVVEKLCKRCDVPFFYYYDDKEFTTDKSLYQDAGHLNKFGADAFTAKFIKQLRKVLNK